LCEQHQGETTLNVQVVDEQQKTALTFMAKNAKIHIDHAFYHWLQLKQMDGVLRLIVK
jgi:hypothetical protein